MSRATFTRAEVNALLDPTAGGIARGVMHHRDVVSSARRPARGDIQLALLCVQVFVNTFVSR